MVLLILGNIKANQQLRALEQEYESQSVQLTKSLQRAYDESVTSKELQDRIDSLIADNDTLRKDIKDLKSRPVSVGSIEATAPGTTETVLGDFPKEYLYRLESGLPVAQHTYDVDKETFTADTFDLEVEMNVVTTEDRAGKKRTYIDSNMTSSYVEDGEQYPVDIVANFAHTKPDPTLKLLDPHVNLGVVASVPGFSPRASLGISTSSIGPTSLDNSVRFSNISVQAGKSLAIGLDPVGVNVSKLAEIPLIQDTWIWGGTSVELLPSPNSWSVTLSISSTL